jgi:hypothetical protein
MITDVIAATVRDDEKTAQVAIWLTDETIHLLVRSEPTSGAPRPRWIDGTVPAALWPGRNASTRKGAIGTVQGYLRQRLANEGEVTIDGLYVIEMTDADRDALGSGATQPNSLFTRIARVFQTPAPRSFRHETLQSVSEWLVDEPIMALHNGDALDRWTVSVLATPAEPTAAEPVNLDGITLADGTTFVPVMLPHLGMTNVDLLRRMRNQGIIVLLHGEPGTGKSRSVEAAFPGHIRLECNEETARQDIVGGYLEGPDGNLIWINGPLLEAMTANDGEGEVLFVDEAPLADPRVLASIYAAVDGRREVVVSENRRDFPEPVKAGPNFYVVFAGNLNVPGAVLSEALDSRCEVQPEYVTDYDTAAKLLGTDHEEIVTVARNMETKRQHGEVTWAPQMRDLLGYKKAAEAVSVQFALSNLVGKVKSESDRDVLLEVISLTMGVSNIPGLRI